MYISFGKTLDKSYAIKLLQKSKIKIQRKEKPQVENVSGVVL